MLYAGAVRVLSTELEAELRWTVATHWLPNPNDPTVDTGVVVDLVEVSPIVINSFEDLVPEQLDPDLNEEGDLKRSSGPRNIRWIVLDDAITFVENS